MELFYKLFLIDPVHRTTVQLCPFVKSGLMHKYFTKHLRPDGRGIDYSDPEILNFDTAKVLNDYLFSQHPYWRTFINNAIQQKNAGNIQYGLEMAGRIKLDLADPSLMASARDALRSLK